MADDALHDERVDVAARQDGDRRSAVLHLARQDRGDAHGARGLDDELGALEQHEERSRDVILFDSDDLVDDVADDFEVDAAGLADGDPVGDSRCDRDLGRLPCDERDRVGRRIGGLHPDDAHGSSELGRLLFDRAGDSRDEPSAADRNEDGVDIRLLLQDLETERALTHYYVAVVEGVDEDGARLLRELGRCAQRLIDDVAAQLDVGAILLGGRELRQGDAHRHEDGRADAQLARCEGHALGVVAGRGGDDSACLLVVAQVHKPVVRTADLVGTGALQVLAFEPDIRPQHL